MSIFSKVAMPRPPSNTFDLSHDRKFSGHIGELMPISVMECVPGDRSNTHLKHNKQQHNILQ
jgi:hypothetical protein